MKLKRILSIVCFVAGASQALAKQYKQLTDVPTVYIRLARPNGAADK